MFSIYTRYRELQAAYDSKVTELQSELKLKQFELDRSQMLYEETSQSLKQANVDTTKYQHKLEVSINSIYVLCFGKKNILTVNSF